MANKAKRCQSCGAPAAFCEQCTNCDAERWKQALEAIASGNSDPDAMVKMARQALFDFDALDEFTRAYMECALWSSTDGNNPLDRDHGIEDIAYETAQAMMEDCKKFQDMFGERIDAAPETSSEYTNRDRAGHDLWLTRNGHGTGFWETSRWPKDLGLLMDKQSQLMGQYELYVGDDGLIYH